MQCELCGVVFRGLNYKDVVRVSKKYKSIYTISMDHMWWALHWEKYREAINRGVCTADGTWVKRFLELKCKRKVDRLAGSRITEDFLRIAKDNDLRVLFVGGTDEVLRKAKDNIYDKFHLEVHTFNPGMVSYPFKEEKINAVKKIIREKEPHMVFFSLGGAPKQELFIDSISGYMKEEGVLISMGIGGTLDMLAGNIRIAPLTLSNLGLEWLWRGLEGRHRLPKIKRGFLAMSRVFLRFLRGKC